MIRTHANTPAHRREIPGGIRGTLVAFCLVTVVLSGAPSAAASASGREQATKHLAEAESAIAEATRLGALWTTAREAYVMAQRAHANGDFPTAVRHAKTAAEQARMGIAQQGYPPLRY